MPRIRLKPNSAEYDDGGEKRPRTRCCDMPSCLSQGEFKAPRDRGLKDYYWFCLEHVQEYNKAWDFFSGMSQRDIEEHIVRSTLWDRPTRRYDAAASAAEKLKRAAWQTYHFTEEEPPEPEQKRAINTQTPEGEALAIMGLAPPLDFETIRNRYKELAKKLHPDVNPGDKKAEDAFKSVNMAYTILRLAYEKFDKQERA